MRTFWILLLVSGMAFAQTTETKPKLSAAQPASTAQSGTATPAATAKVEEAADPHAVVIPAGSKIPLSLKQAIST